MISLRSKSASLTRRERHSDTRRPPPYISVAHSRGMARSRESTNRTSLGARTTGNRRVRLAGSISGNRPTGLASTAVEEEYRMERLVLGGRADPLLCDQVREERRYLTLSHASGVPPAVEKNEPPHPIAVGLLRSHAVSSRAQAVAEALQQSEPPFGLGTTAQVR